MKLSVTKRTAQKKSESKGLRRDGRVPAIIYVKGKEAEAIAVDRIEFGGLLRKVQPGHLPTTIFTLEEKGAKARKAIVKDIQYEPTTYDVIHLDFEELIDDVKVNVKVPIELIGVVDCVGVKLGGFLRQVIRHIRVRCLPKDLPASFPLDVKNMGQRDARRLKDLEIPETVRPLADLNEVAVLIAKR